MKKTNAMLAMTAAMMLAACTLTSCGEKASTADTMAENNLIEAAPSAKGDAADDAVGGAEAEASYEPAAEAEAGEADAFAFKSDRKLMKDAVEGAEYAGAMEFAAEAPTAASIEDNGDYVEPDEAVPVPDSGEPFVLTAGEWNDNENWGFFANLVHNGTIEFPSYGLDPVSRIAVTVTNGGAPVGNQAVQLCADDVIWTAKTDKNGKAYLFYDPSFAGKDLTIKTAGAEDISLTAPQAGSDQGGMSVSTLEYTIETGAAGTKYDNTEVMFILDTTGSMGDEITYLQKDFSAIAEETANGNITFSVNFYRDEGDEYVTRCNPFTDDVKEIQRALNAEYADGGGDTPEAVAEILDETMHSADWHADTNKIAFLIFDAPPHDTKINHAILADAIAAAAGQGIRLVPVVASNADRETELFGRAAAIMTGANYVFLTDDSGVGGSHLEPIIGDYDVELLHDIIVRNIREIAE